MQRLIRRQAEQRGCGSRRTKPAEHAGTMPASRGGRLAEAETRACRRFKPGNEGTQHLLLVAAARLAEREGSRPHRRAGMRHGLDVGIVKVETMCEGAVCQRGNRGGGAPAQQQGGGAVRTPRLHRLMHDARRFFLARADGNSKPVGEAHPCGVENMFGYRRRVDAGNKTGNRGAVAGIVWRRHGGW